MPSPDPNDVMVLLMLVQMSGMVGPSDRYILDETPEEDEAPTSLTERTFIID